LKKQGKSVDSERENEPSMIGPSTERKAKNPLLAFGRRGLFPLVIYAILFCLLTYPLILNFSSHFFTDAGDGLQNVWNIWWVNKAVTGLHQSPWSTAYLHFPHGSTLLAHTLNPFNGFLGVILLRFLSLTQAFNFIIIFSFAVGGLTAFLLAYHFSRSYWGSLLAGFIFTFSNYHFTHAEGHLQLVALEWIPLFILGWFVFVTKPTIGRGLTSALALFAVILCDYYYFFYCVLTAVLIVLWEMLKRKNAFFLFSRARLFPFLTFLAGVLLTSAPLVVALVLLNLRNPLAGWHDPEFYSLDLLAPFIPGGHWRFASLTEFYWSRLPGNIHENSVHLGLSLVFVLVYVWLKRKKIQEAGLGLWYGVLILFAILSLGPVLHIWGRELSWLKLPYALLEFVFPPLKMGGVPVRMMVMVMLGASVIAAIGMREIMASGRKTRWLILPLIGLLLFEYLPKPMPETRIPVPEYVKFLTSLPAARGVIDLVADPSRSLYYQTVHHKPLAFGYIARVPMTVEKRNQRIRELIAGLDFNRLYRSYHFRYLVIKGQVLSSTPKAYLRLLFDDGEVRIYELGAGLE
jgi:hypothetical protein